MKAMLIRIKDLFGLTFLELTGGKSVEISGKNGTGKSSALDGFRYAMTNASNRKLIVKQGAEEGQVYVEIDDKISIDRKKRTELSDFVSVKNEGKRVTQATEAFVRELFTPLQLDPIKFLDMPAKDQNRIILDLIEFAWSMEWIKERFGEIVPDVDYDQNILGVLNDIQSDDGYYYLKRHGINLKHRNNQAMIEEIGSTIPSEYNARKWQDYDLAGMYTNIEQIRQHNRDIVKSKEYLESTSEKMKNLAMAKDNEIGEINTRALSKKSEIDIRVAKLTEEIKALEKDAISLVEDRIEKIDIVEDNYKKYIHELNDRLAVHEEIVKEKVTDTYDLEEEAKSAEHMRSFLNEYARMCQFIETNKVLKQHSEILTDKIELARTLPGVILQDCTIPVDGLTIVNCEPRINGLPISNLSDGEKLNLCVDVAKAKESSLNLLLIDGVEKLSDENRNALYSKCKANDVQFIASRTTNENELKVVEL